MSVLIIAEKTELSKAIADAIDGTVVRTKPYIEKGNYIIVACQGHILKLYEPEDYDEKYRDRANMSLLPIYFPDWKKKVDNRGRDGKILPPEKNYKLAQLKLIDKLLKQAEYVIHAGDSDDEGQCIVDEVLEFLDYRGEVRRLQTNDVAQSKMKKALANTWLNGEKDKARGQAAKARSIADMMIGVNATRKIASVLGDVRSISVGRVQTPTLGLVHEREKALADFSKQYSYSVYGNVRLQNIQTPEIPSQLIFPKAHAELDESGNLTDKSYASLRARQLKGHSLQSISITKEIKHEYAPLPFNSSKLSLYCSQHFGLEPEETMNITNELRWNYKAITYNRTECQYLYDTDFADAPNICAKIIKNLNIPNSDSLGVDLNNKPRCFNSAKIAESTAHIGIIPTESTVNITNMPPNTLKVYTAICNRYLAQFMKPIKRESTILTAPLNDGENLKATASKILDFGYSAFLNEKEASEINPLCKVPQGEYSGSVSDSEIVQHETKPPSRFTKATLEAEMTKIAKHVTDPEAKRLLIEKDKDKTGENGSIGTSATRAFIIETLEKRMFISIDSKRKIHLTEKGKVFYDILPDCLKYADSTAYWWVMLENIAEGKQSSDVLFNHVLGTIDTVLNTKYPTNIDTKALLASPYDVCDCPVLGCGGIIRESAKMFLCSNVKKDGSGCKFIMMKENTYGMLKGKTVSRAQAKKMIKSPNGALFENLYSEAKNKTYNANVKAVPTAEGKVSFMFANTKSLSSGRRKSTKKKSSLASFEKMFSSE